MRNTDSQSCSVECKDSVLLTMESQYASPKQPTDSWCQTHVNVVEANFTWIINNFSFCNEKPGEALESTVFSAPNYDVLKWRMQFYPTGNNPENKDYVSLFLHLVTCNKPSIKVDFRFCILDKDGREVNERRTTEKWQFFQGRQSGFPKFVKKDFVQNQANGLLLDDKLQILCRIKSATGNVQRTNQDTTSPPAPDLLLQMSDDFEQLFEHDKFSDVSLVACNSVKFPAHKNILSARSPVFAAMFEHNMKEAQENTVQIHDVDPETLRAMLKFIYTGKVDDIQGKAGKLLGAADQYALDGLKITCEQVLCKYLSIQDAADCLLIAELHNASRLKEKALNFIRAHLKSVLDTQAFKTLSESQPALLEEILRSMTLP